MIELKVKKQLKKLVQFITMNREMSISNNINMVKQKLKKFSSFLFFYKYYYVLIPFGAFTKVT